MQLTRKDWDSEFFGREIWQGTGVGAGEDVATAVHDADERGVWGIEVQAGQAEFAAVRHLEDQGFRLVDSRVRFVTEMGLGDVGESRPPYGVFRPIQPSDRQQIDELTDRGLVDNPNFFSRYKDPWLFTREESCRYYRAWHDQVMASDVDLFVVWAVDDVVAGFFSFLRLDAQDGLPLYKGILTAVHPDHQGHSAQNRMQNAVFSRLGSERWLVDNTTQVTNSPVIRNHLKAGKQFHSAQLTLFRRL